MRGTETSYRIVKMTYVQPCGERGFEYVSGRSQAGRILLEGNMHEQGEFQEVCVWSFAAE